MPLDDRGGCGTQDFGSATLASSLSIAMRILTRSSVARARLVARAHTLIKTPMHAVATMQMTARAYAFCKMRGLAAGLGVMLVDEGGADEEAGGDSAC
eukprot:COSAG02_NODE_4167_length_5679_cov_8.313799_5_plen_97_part_01